jgi:hypothetical protein
MWSWNFQNFDVFGFARYNDLFATVLDIDIVWAGSNEGGGGIGDLFWFGFHAAEGDKGFGDFILSLNIEIVGTWSDCRIHFPVRLMFLSSKDKCH